MPDYAFTSIKMGYPIDLYDIPFTNRRRKIRLEAKGLFKTKWINNPNIFCLGHSILHEGRDLIKEHNKQKHEAMWKLHY